MNFENKNTKARTLRYLHATLACTDYVRTHRCPNPEMEAARVTAMNQLTNRELTLAHHTLDAIKACSFCGIRQQHVTLREEEFVIFSTCSNQCTLALVKKQKVEHA